MPKLSIVIPTYNERENLPILLEKLEKTLCGIDFEVIIVDDDSPDGTWRLAEELARTKYPWLRVVRRVGERGLASAVIRGFSEAQGEYVAVMDADLQHPPETLPQMLEKAFEEKADVVIASRYARGGGVEGWSRLRLLVSKGATLLAYLLLPEARRTTDPMSGFFLVKRELLNSCIGELKPRGYKILLEVLVKCKPAKIVDVAYMFRRRFAGESKLGIRTMLDYILHVLELNRYRVLKNAAVGLSGLLVLWSTLYLLSDMLGINSLLAYLAAIEASILNNFFWNDRLVFGGRGKHKLWYRRLAEYHGAVALGATSNYAIFTLLHALLHINKYIASLTGVITGFILNYLASEHGVWKP